MAAFFVAMLIVLAMAILVALAFTHKQYAGVGCILALALMSCGLLSAVAASIFH